MADDEDFIAKELLKLSLDDSWTSEEDYYVHIDVLHGCSSLVSTRINSFMARGDAYDPRRAVNFPTDLADEADRDHLALKQRRQLGGDVWNSYYELWKVCKNFSLDLFGKMVELLSAGVKVRIVRFIDNDHDINVFDGKKKPA